MSKILIAGDYVPQNRIISLNKRGDYSFFNDVKELIKKYDFSIVNLEAPIVSEGIGEITKHGPNLKTDESVIGSLKYAGISMVTLANNHINDYGSEGISNTVKILDKNNIRYVGVGKSREDAAEYKICQNGHNRVAIINCCEHEFSIVEQGYTANPLELIPIFNKIIEAKTKADNLIIITHGGSEHCLYPSLRMKETYRFFIDAGADAVINHHQHCINGYEIYKGKLIYYGIGNFCFDRYTGSVRNWERGLMVGIDTDNLDRIDIHPFLQCAETAEVKLIEEDEYGNLLQVLNEAIVNDEILKNKEMEYFKGCSRQSSLVFQPYTNRILSALYRRNLIPSILSKQFLLRLRNHLDCESHFDKIQYWLHQNT